MDDENRPKQTNPTRRAVVSGMIGVAGAFGLKSIADKLTTPNQPDYRNLQWKPGKAITEVKIEQRQFQPISQTEPEVPHVPFLTPTPDKPKEAKEMTSQELLSKIAQMPLRVPKNPNTKIDYTSFDTIVNTSFPNPERVKAEKLYLNDHTKTLDQIDQGFWVIQNPDFRAELLSKRHEKRLLKQDPRLKEIPVDMYRWFEERNIHPEIGGICLDAQPIALKAISDIQNLDFGYRVNSNWQFFVPKNTSEIDPDLGDNPITPEQTMISIGGMAELMSQESSLSYPYLGKYDVKGFKAGERRGIRYPLVNIGMAPALELINPIKFPTAKSDLVTLANELSHELKIDIDPANIPGSTPTALSKDKATPTPSSSQPKSKIKEEDGEFGGAVGNQKTANNELALKRVMNKVKYAYNPFDPTSGLVGAWVFLATRQRHLPVTSGDVINRAGYLAGEKYQESRNSALAKWNGNPAEIFAVSSSDQSYRDTFNKPKSKV